MKKLILNLVKSLLFICSIALFPMFTSCSKETVDENQEQTLQDPKYVPFFEVAKGTSISKNIFREKPIVNDSEEFTLLYSTYNEKESKASGSSSGTGFITALALHFSDNAYTNPTWQDYNVIPVDLNEGAGGKYIYLMYSKDTNFYGHYYNLNIHHWWTSIDYWEDLVYDEDLYPYYPGSDLNEGAGGAFLYLFYYVAGASSQRVVDIAIASSYSPNVLFAGPGGPWHKINSDLNEGAGGKYIYLFYSLPPNKYICDQCAYIYDPEVGDESAGIDPGTSFSNLPSNWLCPTCGAGKEYFERYD